MKIDFSKIMFDLYGNVERPTMILQSPHGDVISVMSQYYELSMDLKYNEISNISFKYPYQSDNVVLPGYDDLVGGSYVRIDPYGVFIINNPEEDNDGTTWYKQCDGYSREYEFSKKNIVFEAGTYKFWDPIDPENSMLGMCVSKVRGWTVGNVPSSLWNKYRTFDQTDSKLLDFMYNTMQEPYGCIVVFDTYNCQVNIVDANDKASILPIYLSMDNLLTSISIKESDDNMATKISVYGADGVDIRNVNPTGTNEIINLGYAISKHMLPKNIEEKYLSWKTEILSQQQYYTGLVAIRNSLYARLLTEQIKLTELKNELTSLDNLRTVNIQGRAMATEYGPEDKEGTVAYFDARLEEIADQYESKEAEIKAQEEIVNNLQSDYDTAISNIIDVNNRLKIEAYFSSEELDILDKYFIEGDFTDSTFAVFDVDISGSHDSFTKDIFAKVEFKDTSVIDVDMPDGSNSRILMISGGGISVIGDGYNLSADIMYATLEVLQDGEIVCSVVVGSGEINDDAFSGGNISFTSNGGIDIDAVLSGMTQNTSTTTDRETGVTFEEVIYSGDFVFDISSASIYFTRNVTEYQRYEVEQELYDHASSCIEELAYPTYEFEIDSCNFVFTTEFIPYKDVLQLGSAIYLRLNENILLNPVLLEVHLEFDDIASFKLVLSNEFQSKRPDNVNDLKELLDKAQSTSHTLDTKKYEYSAGKLSGAAAAFDEFMKNGLNAAYQQVTAGVEQEVQIDEAGIKVKSKDSNEFIMMSNGMIALIDSEAKTSKMALGHFYSQEYKTDYYGIVADLIFGTLVAGKGLSIACEDINDGSMLFEANSKGVQIHNGRFYIDHDRGGQIALDPTYGFAIGTNELYTFDDNGHAVLNTDNANLYIDLDGNLHIKGTLDAVDGKFSGIVQATDFLDQSGRSMMTEDGKFDSDYLDLGNIQLDGVTGDITMTGNLNLSNLSSITWGALSPVKYQFSTSLSGPWHDTMQSGDKYRRDSLDGGITWGDPYQFVGEDGANGSDANVPNYIKETYIDSTRIESPLVRGGTVAGAEFTDINQKSKLVLNPSSSSSNVADLNLYSGSNVALRIYDNIAGSITWYSYSNEFLTTGSFGTSVYGDWDFSNANVEGLSARFG